ALFLNALDRYYEMDRPAKPVNAPLYPDSGLLISYYMIQRDHFADLPIPQEVYDQIDEALLEDIDGLVPLLRALSESDPFFLRYITWVVEKAAPKKDYDAASLRDLVFGNRQIANFKEGQYTNGIQLFKFCRTDRKYPCRMIVRSHDGTF